MTWIENIFNRKKAVVGMCHIQALPTDPFFDETKGVDGVFEAALQDVKALQEGGIDGIQFTNEFSTPYQNSGYVSYSAITAMAYVIGRLKPYIKVPYGVNFIGDPKASIELCKAVGAKWTRGTFYGTWATNQGVLEGDSAGAYRIRHAVNYDDLKLIHYYIPENAAPIGFHDVWKAFCVHVAENKPDAVALCGNMAGQKADIDLLKKIREQFPQLVLLVTTGVNETNIQEILSIADAVFVGTSLKVNHNISEMVDRNAVEKLMKAAYQNS